MTKTTTNLLLMLITIVAGTYFYITCCTECGTTTMEPPTEKEVIIKEPATTYPFTIEGADFSYSANDNYNFNTSSNNFIQPLSNKVTQGISELQAYLGANKNSMLNVTGFYTSEEENNSAFPDLGLARANSIKNDLASKGISTAQINTKGKLMNDMIAKDGAYWGPASFEISERSEKTEIELKALYENIKANPLILYFNTAEVSINLNVEQRQKVADISKYLDMVEGSTAKVVGHTDGTGKASTNMRLGQDRANFAKDYLMKNGIASDKIIATSKGHTEPIASNTTEDGKDKNRRTVITLN